MQLVLGSFLSIPLRLKTCDSRFCWNPSQASSNSLRTKGEQIPRRMKFQSGGNKVWQCSSCKSSIWKFFLVFLVLASLFYLFKPDSRTCLHYTIDQRINNGTLLYYTYDHKGTGLSQEDEHWGNSFSHYWHARALAFFSNVDFLWADHKRFVDHYENKNKRIFLKFIPNNYSRSQYHREWDYGSKVHREMLSEYYCHFKKEECMTSWGILFPHELCITWNWITEMIRVDVQSALQQWSNYSGEEMPIIHDDDVYIFDRCGNDSYFFHEGYGPMGFQVYHRYSPSTTREFVLVHDPRTRTHHFCQRYRSYLAEFLRLNFPNSKVVQIENRSRDFYNFAVLSLGKLVFTESSSFSLFAVLSNNNTVIMSDFHGYGFDFITDLPKNFRFAGNGLFVKNQHRWGFNFSTYRLDEFIFEEDFAKLKHWLFTN